MITVAYNADPQLVTTDTFLRESSKARTNHPFRSLSALADVPGGQSLLIVADHGLSGVQGVGSGSGSDTTWGVNLNHEHFTVFEAARQLESGPAYATNPQWIFYWAGLRGAGTNDKQQTHVLKLFSKINAGGVVFLAGCNVGDGDAGSSLLRNLSLIAQRSIAIVAARTKVAWTPEGSGSRNRMIRLVTDSGRAFNSYDLVGFMGERPLTSSERDDVIARLVVPATL